LSGGKANWAEGLGAAIEPILLNAERQAASALANQIYILDAALEPENSGRQLVAVARQELDRQTARKRFLPAGMIQDTGWAILLDVFVSELDGKHVRISDSADRWSIGPETAVRQIAGLIASNLIRREPSHDPKDTARLGVTPCGLNVLQRTLEISK
jgi:hypothetical protein